MLKTKFKDYELESPLMNASGVRCMDKAELDLLEGSKAGAWVSKTATLSPREGNSEPRYAPIYEGDTLISSINSMGLPNFGIDYYLDYFENLPQSSKPRFLSATTCSSTENELTLLTKKIQDSSFDGFTELNLSCPNVVGHPQIAYDFPTTERILEEVFSFFTKPLGIKLPPYFDLAHIDTVAEILNKFPIAFINTCNSVGNGLMIDIETETVLIKPKNGFGGIGGKVMLGTALANVRAFRERLYEDIAIIGTGGVTSGKEAFLHILAGADLVQIGTQLQEEGVGVFERINNELIKIMQNKGYKNIIEFKNKLKSI